MAAVTFPVKRPVGRALIVATSSTRAQPLAAMQALGYTCGELEDAYAAAAEIFKRPLVYRALILSLTSLYREELALIATLKRKLPHVEVWLTHLEGRQAALAEAMRLGADGLLGEDGALHRIAMPTAPADASRPAAAEDVEPEPPATPLVGETLAHGIEPEAADAGEPVLSADELRALLQEQPMSPPEMES